MTFISYAQNFEDVMLWRALKSVENGFYIDVGANDPVIDSVTLAFYERGWKGINVEPMHQYYSQLCIKRPADINLPFAVGDTEGEIVFYDVADTGLSTLDPSIAQQHRTAGRSVNERRVQASTLSTICRDYAESAIHFLKIDVEGLEASVLRGMDFRRWRPWIVVVEATRPQSQITSEEEWEHILLAGSYDFAYFDGLNRFYIAQEHKELRAAFQSPPNYFDGFQLRMGHAYGHSAKAWDDRVQAAETQAASMTAQMREMELDIERELAAADQTRRAALLRALQAEQQIQAIYASTSWRLTRPVRAVKNATARFSSSADAAPSTRKDVTGQDENNDSPPRLKFRSRLRGAAIALLMRFPPFYVAAKKIHARSLRMRAMKSRALGDLSSLGSSAQSIVTDLHRQVEKTD